MRVDPIREQAESARVRVVGEAFLSGPLDDRLKAAASAVRGGEMPTHCSTCGNTAHWWTRRDADDGWHCAICEPQPGR